MSNNFPSSLDSYSTLIDNVDDVLASDPNDRGDAIEAIETKIGIDSSSIATSIDYFLKHVSGAYRTHQHDGSSDDGAKLDWDNCWTDAVHDHNGAAEGGTVVIAGGGTGATTAQNALNALAGAVTANRVLRGNGSNIVLAQVNLSSDVTGTLADTSLDAITTASKVNTSSLYGTTYLPDATVDTTALKTATGEVSAVNVVWNTLTLPGGEYGFYPQVKESGGSAGHGALIHQWDVGYNMPTSYETRITLRTPGSGGFVTYARQRYITSSGTDQWIFLLINKATKNIISAYQAFDHPAYGNGGDFKNIPHPFPFYDQTTQEIILVDKETCLSLLEESKRAGKSILTIINDDMRVDYMTEKTYDPLHSGKFLNQEGRQVKELIPAIAPYIKVKRLILKEKK